MTAIALARSDLAGPPGVELRRLVRVEFRKLIDTRAGRWLALAIIAGTPVAVALVLVLAKPADLTFAKIVGVTQSPQKLLLPLIAILSVTCEWTQRTGLTTFTLAPNRARVLEAKAIATLIMGGLTLASSLLAAAVANALGRVVRGGSGNWSFGLGDLRDIVIVQLTGLGQGLAFAMILLVSAAAVSAYFVVPNLATLGVNAIPGFKNSKGWVDLNSAQSPLYNHEMSAHGWAQLATSALIWVLGPLAIGIARVARSEVKSG
jgi:ABC-2 type transport system permease protein